MSVVVGHDAIHANIGRLPAGPCAGYTTGSADIRWTANDWITHPGAVRICQDAAASDHTADVLDVERYAATNAEAAGWFKAAEKAYLSGARPGQRSPAIYTSASNVTPLVNALIAGGVKDGCGLWVANWNLTQVQAYADVVNAAGPFPIVAVQWASGQYYDTDVFSGSWLARVSAAPSVWGELVTDGTLSLEQIAEHVGMLPSSVLRHTATHYGAYDATTSAYLDGLAAGTIASDAPVPPGAKLWVRK
jgi:hypothetical protein